MSGAERKRADVTMLGAAIAAHEEDAVRHQMEIAAALAAIDGADLASVLDQQADRSAGVVEHSGVHGKDDAVSARPEARLERLEAAHSRSDFHAVGAADDEAGLLEALLDARRHGGRRGLGFGTSGEEQAQEHDAHRAIVADQAAVSMPSSPSLR